MKTLIASVFALGLLGSVATPADALTIHVGGGGYGYHHHHGCRGWGWHHGHRWCRGYW